MIDFLKNYGVWIFVVLMLGMHLVPMLRRGRGMGCCGGHQHGQEEPEKVKGDESQSGKHSAGCH